MAQKQYEIMPNWCWNNLEVTGDEIQLREFVEKSENCPEGSEFTFNGTYPMPEEFKEIKTGAYTDENGESHRRWREIDGKSIPVSDKEMKQLKEKYGSENWYDWNIANWGTKWDACESEIGNNDINFFSVSFQTAWSPPIDWIDNIITYADKRRSEYPTIEELVVALYDTDDKAAIEKRRADVKAKYPKP